MFLYHNIDQTITHINTHDNKLCVIDLWKKNWSTWFVYNNLLKNISKSGKLVTIAHVIKLLVFCFHVMRVYIAHHITHCVILSMIYYKYKNHWLICVWNYYDVYFLFSYFQINISLIFFSQFSSICNFIFPNNISSSHGCSLIICWIDCICFISDGISNL